MQQAEAIAVTSAEYLAGEDQSEFKHEYLAGEIYAMVGATDTHVTTAGNLFVMLRQHLKGGPCKTYISDMKLHIATADAYFYPDVMVTCSDKDRENHLAKSEPILIAEVLSPSTEAYDRGRKFSIYRQLPTLQHYWLIDTINRTIDTYARTPDDEWLLHSYDSESQAIPLKIEQHSQQISIDELFEF